MKLVQSKNPQTPLAFNIEDISMGKLMAMRDALRKAGELSTLQKEIYDFLNNAINTKLDIKDDSVETYYQPDLPDSMWGEELNSWEVFKSKDKAQSAFPDFDILEYKGEEIEGREYVDDDYED